MGYYDHYEYYFEPSEYDIMVEEFKDELRKSVKTEIQEEIKSLRQQLDELKEFRDNRTKLIHEHEVAILAMQTEVAKAQREAKESEEKWKKARLYQLLGDYLTVGWKVGYKWEYGEKCDECDKDRRIHFFSPSGREYTEECQCAKRYYEYFPQEVTLSKMYVRKKNFHYYDNGQFDYHNRYYTVKQEDEFDIYETSDVYEHGDVDFETININRAVFLNEEDCRKYCDWKNEREFLRYATM